MHNKLIPAKAAIGCLLLAASIATTRAQSVTNADSSATLNLGASWVGGVAAGPANIAVWDSTVAINTSKSLGAGDSWAGIQILNPAGLITIAADGNTLTAGASGIDLSQATVGMTISSPIALAANQTWLVANGLTLTAGGVVSGAERLTLNNGTSANGTVILSVANTFSGGTIINSGVVQPNVAASFGPGAVTNNGGTLLLSVFPNSGIMTNAFNVSGTSLIDMYNRSVSDVLDGAWSGSGTVLVTNDTASGSTLTFGGATGGNMANFTGSIIVVSNASGTASAGALRFNNGGSQANTGNAQMSINLGANSSIILENRDAGTTSVGELTGGSGTAVTGQTSGNGTETWSIGGKNTTATFAGIFKNQGSSALTALTKVGTGTFILTGANSYTGATTVSGGILQIGDGATSGAGQLGTANVTDNAILEFARPDSTAVANLISGTGSLVQAAPSVLALSSANTYGGATIVTNGGTIYMGALIALPVTTALTLGGSGSAGTLDMAGINVQVSALNTGSGATGSTVGSSGGSIPTIFTVNATNGASSFSGVIEDTLPSGGSGVLALVVENGKVTLSGANNFSGSTTISNGVLALGAGGSIATSPVIVLAGGGGSVLDASAAGGFNLTLGQVLAGSGGINGNLTATGSLITPGTNGVVGTLTCSNNLSLSGVTVQFDLSSSPASGNDQVIVGGALQLSGLNSIQISPLTALTAGTYRLFVCGSVSGGLGNLQLVGSPGTGLNAVLNVTGTEVDLVVTATAAPFIWAGDGTLNQWDYATANWRSNSTAATFNDGDFAVFNDAGSHSPAVDITAPVSPATVTVSSSVNYTFGSVGGLGKITGFGSLTKTNTATLTLLTPNDYTGGTFINQGTIQVGNGTVSGTAIGNGNVADNGSLVFDQPDGSDFTNIISGAGSVSQIGSGTVMLSGNNTYSGGTSITAGILQVGDGNTSGSLGTNMVTDTATLNYDRSDSIVQSGKVTGPGAVNFLAGTVTMTASNDFTGMDTINSGATLQLGAGGASGSVILSNVVDNGTLAFDHSFNETNGTAINGSGGINKLGTNTLTLTGTNTYNGDTAVSAGILVQGIAGTIPNGSGYGNLVLNAGATSAGVFDMNGFDTTINGLSGSSNAVLGQVVNNGGTGLNVLTIGNGDATATYYGIIEDNNNGGAGKIALVKTGAGTITLASTNGFTGGTILSNGVVAMQNALANGSGGFSAFGPTNNSITFTGGALTLFNSSSDNGSAVFAFFNPLIVPAGQSGTITLFERGDLDSTLTGSGTLNTVDPGARGTIAGNWSAFTGTINITSGQFRINNSFGYSNAVINIEDGADLDTGGDGNPGASGQVVDIGELDGTSAATIGNGGKPSPSQTWRVGWKNTTSTFAGTIVNGTTSGSTGDAIYKVGTGTWILSGQNTYANSTTISNGVLALTAGANGDGSISISTPINILPNGILDVSGRSDDALQLGAAGNQTLEGRGVINGQLVVNGAGLVAPGGGQGGSTGILTATNSISLGGTVWMKLNRTNSLNSDRLVSSLSTITYGGVLVVTNIGPALQPGDTFTLFSGGGLSAGTFGTIILPSYQSWDTSQLGVNGSITFNRTLPAPGITNVDYSQFSSGYITVYAGNGAPNGPVNVLTTTNLALPVSQWITNTATTFDSNGNLDLSIAVDPTLPQNFIILQAF